MGSSPATQNFADLVAYPIPFDSHSTVLESSGPLFMVSRADERPEAGFWSIGLRDRLPLIPIPLRPPHTNARLDIQVLLHRVYDAAGYQLYIHEGTPSPDLDQDDVSWARQFLPPPTP